MELTTIPIQRNNDQLSTFLRLGKLIITCALALMGLDQALPLKVTGTLFPCYFSRTCINLVLFNRSIAQLYQGVLIPCVAGTIFDSLLLFQLRLSAGIFLITRLIELSTVPQAYYYLPHAPLSSFDLPLENKSRAVIPEPIVHLRGLQFSESSLTGCGTIGHIYNSLWWADKWIMYAISSWEPDLCRPVRLCANTYYILWHKLYKMNNNLQFVLRRHKWRLSAKQSAIYMFE